MVEIVVQFKFDGIETGKKKFHSSKIINVSKVDIEKMLVSHEFVYGKNKETYIFHRI